MQILKYHRSKCQILIIGINMFQSRLLKMPKLCQTLCQKCQTEASMPRHSQRESAYVHTASNGKCLCPDFRASTRLSCIRAQTFIYSLRSCSDYHAFTKNFCFPGIFVRSCPDFCPFTKSSYVYWIFVRSCPDIYIFAHFLL